MENRSVQFLNKTVPNKGGGRQKRIYKVFQKCGVKLQLFFYFHNLLIVFITLGWYLYLSATSKIQSVITTVWGGTLWKRFCNMLHGSCSSAKLPVKLSAHMQQNLFLNLTPQSVEFLGTVLYSPPGDRPRPRPSAPLRNSLNLE